MRPIFRAEHLMSMPAFRPGRWTLAEVRRLIETRQGFTPRYELVDGELLVTPSPTGRHQRIVFELARRIAAYVDGERLGELRLGPHEVWLEPDSDQYVEPDLFVVPAVDGKRPPADARVTRLLLAVEVLSAGSARHDRITKRALYQRSGVPEYWVVDGETEAFEVWRPGDERAALVDERLVWRPAGATTEFELDVRRFFDDVRDTA